MSGFKPPSLMSQKVSIDRPHGTFGSHVDVVTPLGSGIRGVEKLRIGTDGRIATNEICLKGGFKFNVNS